MKSISEILIIAIKEITDTMKNNKGKIVIKKQKVKAEEW